MSKQAIKSKIDQHIKENGKSQITGPVLNDILTDIVNDYPTDDEVISGITGDAELNTQPSSTKFERWTATIAGTYVNFKDANGNSIVVEDKELEDYDIIISVTNGVAKKNFSKKKDSKTETWSAKEFEKGRQVFYNGSIWESNADTLATDIPGVEIPNTPSKWDLKLKAFQSIVEEDLFQIVDGNGNLIGAWDKRGNFFTSYRDASIPMEAISGLNTLTEYLSETTKFIKNSLFIDSKGQDVFEIRDGNGNIFGSVDSEGTLHVRKIIAGKVKELHTTHDYGVTGKKYVNLPDLEFFRVNIEGQLPTDTSEARTPTKVVVTIMTGDNKKLVTFNALMSIQGQYTTSYLKKGYSIDLYNDEWEEVYLKIGKNPALKGFHMKAFHNDVTHTRDVCGGMMWAETLKSRPYPENLFKELNNSRVQTYNEYAYYADAKYCLTGIPCEVYISGEFFGLYTWRLKKSLENFAMNSANENHIFLDNLNVPGVALGNLNWANYDDIIKFYEVRCPKKKGVTNITKANVVRFFQYMKDVYSGAKDFTNTYQDYMRMYSWYDWVILAELFMHWDSVHNNASYMSYNGKHFMPGLMDLDNTISLDDRNVNDFFITEDIWTKFKAQFSTQIKNRYTQLRNNGQISMENVIRIYGGQSAKIPMSVYTRDYKKWGKAEFAHPVPNMDLIYDTYARRISFLDGQWKIA
ncbi:CotH kinase family protein [Elizabethkingia anophelis]|nr:CotH kinase family protein [Elizabethkingia anophelis]